MEVVVNDETQALFRFAGLGLTVNQQLIGHGNHPALTKVELNFRLMFIQLDLGLVCEVFAQACHVARGTWRCDLGVELGHGDLL